MNKKFVYLLQLNFPSKNIFSFSHIGFLDYDVLCENDRNQIKKIQKFLFQLMLSSVLIVYYYSGQ